MAALESLVLFESGASESTPARGGQALHFGFDREGIKVHVCKSASALVALCIKESPQLALISLPDGEKAISETLAALDELRATESISRLPVLVIGDRDLRDEVLRAGADEFVPRPAYLRDVLNLCRMVVGLRARDDKELRGLVEEYGLFFLLRALSIVGRSAVLELERAGRYAEIHIVAGEVAMARTGRMNGQSAFQHLMLWHDARLRLRLESPSAERKIFIPTLRLLEDASRFAQKFEETASKVGGSRTVFRRVISRAAEIKSTIPAEIEAFSHLCDGRRTLVDIVEESQFRPLDVVKIVHRLEKLGAIERVAVARPTTSDDAVIKDWLTGSAPAAPPAERATVTEAGRRAAEEYSRRADDKAPSEEILPQANLLQRLGAAGTEAQQRGGDRRKQAQGDRHGDRRKQKQKQQSAASPSATAPAPTPTATKPSNGTPATAAKGATPSATPPLDDQETRPFFKVADEPHAAKLSSSAHRTVAGKEPVFDSVEDEFFAGAEKLSKVDPVENFDDLDAGMPTAKKPGARWSLMSLFRPAPPSSAAVRKTPPSSGSSSSSKSSPSHKPTSSNTKKR